MSLSRPHQQSATASSQSSREDAGIIMYTTSWCGDCRRAKRIFAAWSVPFTEVDIEEDRAAAALVTHLNAGKRSVPTILFPDGTKLVEPSNAALEAKLALYTDSSR